MVEETDHRLPEILGVAARRLEAERDAGATLEAITHAAVDTVPGADYAGISWCRKGRVTAQAATNALVDYCDRLQSELGEGPCVQAIESEDTMLVEDMSGDNRWPAFAAAAAEQGMASMISFRLFVRDGTLGSLNLYATRPHRFGQHARVIGELFASQAAVVLSGKRRQDQLAEALATRDVIGQAKGLLMAREKIEGEEAFRLLVSASQEANLKLAEIARWLVADHENPGRAPRPGHH